MIQTAGDGWFQKKPWQYDGRRLNGFLSICFVDVETCASAKDFF